MTELKCSGMLSPSVAHKWTGSDFHGLHDVNFCGFVSAVWIAVKFGTGIHVLLLINFWGSPCFLFFFRCTDILQDSATAAPWV